MSQVSDELFGICQQLINEQPSPAAYNRLHELLVLCCHGVHEEDTAFGNLFSHIDWLCRQRNLSPADRFAVQTARRHAARPNNTHYSAFLSDLAATTRFISAVYRAPIPPSLQLLEGIYNPRTPTSHFSHSTSHSTVPYLRCIVTTFDDNLIHADSDDGPVTISYGTPHDGLDFTYLRRILRPGMQLNLLDSSRGTPTHSEREGAGESLSEESPLLPSLIVVEPDFLIDISALAACFTNYGHHPLLYTFNRLHEVPPTQAILLGNFAGAALDELIHDPATPTDAILQRTYHEQSLRILTCPDFDADTFAAEAEQQVANIREAVAALKSQLSTLNSQLSTFLLEPSFISEHLGLQGRVDLMTSDLRLLVEQKAGRNMKIERLSHDAHGLQREDHYVQLLLYYGVLRYNFGLRNSFVDTRLFYSRYPANHGLLIVNYYRTLFLEAIRLRNQIVATELLIARDGFQRILPLLNTDTIYKGIARDAHFHHYVQPRFMEFSQQLSAITSLERAYFERMMTFVYREQACQKLGTADEQSRATADLWQMPLSAKRERGDILTSLIITDRKRSQPAGGYDLITLQLNTKHSTVEGDLQSPTPTPTLNFRPGDMVVLYHYDQDPPDICHNILYKGTLQDISSEQFVIRLNNGQQSPDVFPVNKSALWAIEHAASDVSTTSAIRGLFRFISGNPLRRALLLGQRAPQADTSLHLSAGGDLQSPPQDSTHNCWRGFVIPDDVVYHPHYDDIILRQKQARDYFLLVGPPGTGKTSMALRFMVLEELRTQHSSVGGDLQSPNQHSKILLTAYTNRAVDEICAMLADADLPFLRLGNAASCAPRFRDHLIDAPTSKPDLHYSLHDIRHSTFNILTATTSMLQARPEVLTLWHFSLCIVDEASQILEPSIIGLLASDAIERFVLIGDHKQLPAVVAQPPQLSAVDNPLLRAIGLSDCRQSLFERILRWEQAQGRTQFIATLTHQGRMHPEVASFPSHAFYHREQLSAVGLPHQQEDALNYAVPPADALDRILQNRRVIFLDSTPQLNSHHSTLNTQNSPEARIVADLLRRIHRFYGERFDAQMTVGVIVPYRSQITAIRQELEAHGDTTVLLNVSIDTVERYQGSQRDVIIYSFTATQHYQLDFLTANTFDEDGLPIDRKLNVALTRARRQMIMVGNTKLLRSVPLFRQLIDDYLITP